MDGYNAPHGKFHSWRAEYSEAERARLGILRVVVTPGKEKASPPREVTWVFKTINFALGFWHNDGPNSLVHGTWIKGKMPQKRHDKYLAEVQFPPTRVPYGSQIFKDKPDGKLAKRQRRRHDGIAVLSHEGMKCFRQLQARLQQPHTHKSRLAMLKSRFDPVVLQNNFVCNGGRKAWGLDKESPATKKHIESYPHCTACESFGKGPYRRCHAHLSLWQTVSMAVSQHVALTVSGSHVKSLNTWLPPPKHAQHMRLAQRDSALSSRDQYGPTITPTLAAEALQKNVACGQANF